MKTANDIRNQLMYGNCLEILKDIESNTVSAILTDPPYGLDNKQTDIRKVLSGWLAGEDVKANDKDFMSKDWQLPGPKIWEEVMRVLKPGGHIFSFSGTRTYDLMVTAMRIAGMEIRDKIDYYCDTTGYNAWTYGCLSEDTELLIDGKWEHYSKAIEGKTTLCFDMVTNDLRQEAIQELLVYDYDETAYRIKSETTDQIVSKNHRCIVERNGKNEFMVAEELAAKGSEIFVPVVEGIMARGNLFNTMARIEPFHYIGKVWCIRVPTGAFVARRNGKVFITGNSGFPKSLSISKAMEKTGISKEVSDQWASHGSALKPANEPIVVFSKSNDFGNLPEPPQADVPFKYEAKASGKERNYGCKNLFWLTTDGDTKKIEKDEYDKLVAENEANKDKEGFVAHKVSDGNIFPCCKPINLMRYLVKMVKMPGENLILDPFCGSGTTAVACILEGVDFVTMEKDQMAYDIAQARIHYFKCLGQKGIK